MTARAKSDQYQWHLPVPPDMVISILQDVEALPALTKPYLPAWAIVDITATVTKRDTSGLPAEVCTTTSAFGMKDHMTTEYQWTDTSCRWRVTSSRQVKSSGCDIHVTPAAEGCHVTVDTWVEFRTLLTPGPILRQLKKLHRIGFESLHEVITTEASRRNTELP
ncbi:hypothetical protein ACNO8X_22720 [Mycobacterium sp. PDNC021]|uniref:hypothetical protein n=1 Tax=Mycobacterium sp. PDNC021 TaxID=3391399 RepID=UPI003AADFB2A